MNNQLIKGNLNKLDLIIFVQQIIKLILYYHSLNRYLRLYFYKFNLLNKKLKYKFNQEMIFNILF